MAKRDGHLVRGDVPIYFADSGEWQLDYINVTKIVSYVINPNINTINQRVVKDIAVGAGGLGFDFWAGQIGHLQIAYHRCFVSSKLCCPGAKQRRLAPPLVTRFGVISRV